MTALTKTDIKIWMNSSEKKNMKERLIITPLLNPEEAIGASSVDVRLGNKFILMKRQSISGLDIGKMISEKENIGKYQQSVRINYHDQFILHPRQLVIGSTFEYVHIPRGLMCYVVGKSSWGRMGLIIATATKIDPGFKGCITLEILNEGEVPITLYPGLPIAQLVFHLASNNNDAYDGTYDCPIGPEFPRFDKLEKSKDWYFWIRNHFK